MDKGFANKIKEKAKRIAEDEGKLRELMDQVSEKINSVAKSDQLKQLFHTVEVFIRMVKNYLSGEYRDYPKRSLLLILFGLIYFMIPIDVIPDFIPLSGFIDDLTVLLWVYKSIRKDIDAFEEWEKKKVSPA